MMTVAKAKVAVVVVAGVLAGIGGVVAIEARGEGATPPVVAATRPGSAPGPTDHPADDAAIREAVIERWQSLQSITAQYDSVCTWYPPEKSLPLPNGGMLEVKDGMIRLPGGEWIKPISGTRASRNAFRYLEERAYYDSVLTEATVQDLKRQSEPYVVRDAYAFSAERAEQLTEHGVGGPPAGMIGDSIMLPEALTAIDVALGLRLLDENRWMDLDRLKEAVIGRDGLGRPTVTFRGDHSWVHTWVLDQEHQNAIVRYTVASTGVTVQEIECERFQEVSGVMLPYHITGRRFSKYAPAGIGEERKEDVTRYTVNDQANTPGSYLMVWPKGSTVLYSPLDVTLTVASGERTLPDDFIREKLAATVAKGTQLPKRAATTQRTARPVGNGR